MYDELLQLESLLDQKPVSRPKELPGPVLQEKGKFLSELTADFAWDSHSVLAVCECLSSLARVDAPTVKHSEVYTALKALAKCGQDTRSDIAVQLTAVIQKLISHWRKEAATEFVDKDLRKSVCKKIASALTTNEFPEEVSRSIALKIERNLRKRDPSMGSKYRKCFQAMMKDIKSLNPAVYAGIMGNDVA